MPNVLIDRDKLDVLANAISAKSGEALTLTLDEMVDAVDGIETGGGITPTLQTKSVTPTESAQIVTADVGYDGLEEVDVGAISSTYVGSGITRRDSTDLTASGATVSVPSGFYESSASKAVASGSATASATKGTVSNHSVTVTPSVTRTAGYVTAGTSSGTAVSVSASELVSGSQTITQNGTVDVTNLAELIVNVSGGGSSGKEFETGTYTPTSDTARPQIKFSGTHSVPPALVFMSDTSPASGITSNSNTSFMLCDMYRCNGAGYPYSATATRYAIAFYSYRSTSTSTVGSVQIQYNSDNTSISSSSYYRYWASTTDFHPQSSSTSRYWRKDRTYKWIAVWM